MSATCVSCTRPMPDVAYACTRCAAESAQKLSELAEVCPAARDVALGLSRRSQGGASGKPGSRLPFDLSATAKLDSVQTVLTRWIELVADRRGHVRPWFTHTGDPIVIGAQWLTDQLEWIRHRAPHADGQWGADEFLTDVEACLRVVRGIARGPAEHKYLGPCGATLVLGSCPDYGIGDHDCTEHASCDGDVYGRAGAANGTCRTCGAQVDQDERRAWLNGEVRDHAFRAAEIANAYGINVNTIRTWHVRGQLVEHGRDRDDRPLFNVGEVLDMAAVDAARRETERAKRERRVAARAAESEDAA